MTREELLRSNEYWTTGIQLQLYKLIEDYLKNNDISKTEFARKLGVSKGYVSQVLGGDFDHKLSKFVQLSLASNKVPIVSFMDLDTYIKNDSQHRSYSVSTRPINYITYDHCHTNEIKPEHRGYNPNKLEKINSQENFSFPTASN